jgi:hypothetical protein
MSVLEVKDKSFSKENFRNYHLVIKQGGNFFYVVYYDTVTKKLIYYSRQEDLTLDRLLQESSGVKKTYLLLDTKRNTLVPSSYFEVEKKNLIFDFVFGSGEASMGNLRYDRLLFDSIVNVYDAGIDVPEAIKAVSEFTVYCDASISLYKSLGRKQLIYIVLRSDFFYIYVLDEGKLHVANTLVYKSINDVLYHLFNIIDKYSFIRKEIDVYLVPSADKIFVNNLVEKARESDVKVFILNDIPKSFLSYKLNSVDTVDLYDFYTFLNIENNRR